MANNLTLDELSALRHWCSFGQKDEPSDHRNIIIPCTELPKLLNGFQSRAMEDKWFIYTDGPDAQGNTLVHMFRSWTGYKIAELKIKVPLDEDREFEEEDSRVTGITWESSQERHRDQTEETAKSMAREVCNWVLDVKLV